MTYLDLYSNRQRVASYPLAAGQDLDALAGALNAWCATASRPGLVLRSGDIARIVRIGELRA